MIILEVDPPLKEAAYAWSHSLFETERKEKAILDTTNFMLKHDRNTTTIVPKQKIWKPSQFTFNHSK